jgi:hypothetical protein
MLTETITKRGLGKPPCYKCTEREPGCHGKCDKYKEWREKGRALKAEEMDARLREKGAQGFLADNTVARKARWRRSLKQ